jgi:cytochrome d ubiquinol oxidase subunit II
MFESFSYLFLQQYWWIIASLLGALLVFLLFVQGGQTMLNTLSSNEEEKSLLVNSLGGKWEFTFTTLVTFGGAMFAAFPKFYSTSFGGAYWVWIAILFCFIIQAVSYEFRRKPGNFLGPKVYEAFLYINGSLGVFLLGTAVATFFSGSEFSLTDSNSVIWQTQTRGLEAAFNIFNVLLGFAIFFLAKSLGCLYFINNIDDEKIEKKARKHLIFNAIPFLVFFLTFLVLLLLKDGFSYDQITKQVSIEKYKYFNNFIEMPVVLVIFLAGVLLVLFGFAKTIFTKSRKGIWFAGLGTVLTVFGVFLIAGLNNTSFYPSTFDLQSSLTIENSSSSKYTLTAMSYVSLLVPFVLAYIFYVWRLMDKKKLDRDEIKNNDHSY